MDLNHNSCEFKNRNNEILKSKKDQLKKLNQPKEKIGVIKSIVLDREQSLINDIKISKLYLFYLIVIKLKYYGLIICFALFPSFMIKSYEDQVRKNIRNSRDDFILETHSNILTEGLTKFTESKYFQNFINLIEKIKGEDNDFKYDQLVCHNLRSFTDSNLYKGRLIFTDSNLYRERLLFLISLRNYFDIKNCTIFSIGLSPDERKTLRKLNFKLVNSEFRRLKNGRFKLDQATDGKKLIYILPNDDEENELILEDNWNLKTLNNLHIIGYSFNQIIKENFKNDKIIRPHSYVFNSSRKLNIVKEYKIEHLDKPELRQLTLHKFDTKKINEETIQTYYSDYYYEHFGLLSSPDKESEIHKNSDYFIEQSNKLKETIFFDKFLKSFNTFKRLLNDDFKFDLIVCYALGHFTMSIRCEYQFVFLICLKDYLNVDCEIYDPAFTENEIKILKQLNFIVIDKEEECKKPIPEQCRRPVHDKKILFFTFGLYFPLLSNILASNWNLKSLDNLYFIQNGGKSTPPYFRKNNFPDFYGKSKLIYKHLLDKLAMNLLVVRDSLKIFKRFNFEPTDDYILGSLNYMSLYKIDVSNIKQEDLDKHLDKYRKRKYPDFEIVPVKQEDLNKHLERYLKKK